MTWEDGYDAQGGKGVGDVLLCGRLDRSGETQVLEGDRCVCLPCLASSAPRDICCRMPMI